MTGLCSWSVLKNYQNPKTHGPKSRPSDTVDKSNRGRRNIYCDNIFSVPTRSLQINISINHHQDIIKTPIISIFNNY